MTVSVTACTGERSVAKTPATCREGSNRPIGKSGRPVVWATVPGCAATALLVRQGSTNPVSILFDIAEQASDSRQAAAAASPLDALRGHRAPNGCKRSDGTSSIYEFTVCFPPDAAGNKDLADRKACPFQLGAGPDQGPERLQGLHPPFS